jgi:CRP-like cAMP-binding protein
MPLGRGKSDHIRLLGGVSLFRACTDKELAHIASLTTEIDVPADDVLCREGESGSEFFVIIDGEASVTIDGQLRAKIGPGNFFGEMALLDGGPRIATVTATTPSRLLVLSRQEFFSLLDGAPRVARQLLTAVGARLRAAEASLHPVGV